jgi:hypothetical protein
MPASCLAYYSSLTIEATYSSEISVDFQRTTWCYTPEYNIIHSLPCEQGTTMVPALGQMNQVHIHT